MATFLSLCVTLKKKKKKAWWDLDFWCNLESYTRHPHLEREDADEGSPIPLCGLGEERCVMGISYVLRFFYAILIPNEDVMQYVAPDRPLLLRVNGWFTQQP